MGLAAEIQRILRGDKSLLLSFDQGLEHGPKIFDHHSIDPEFVFNLALEGDYSGLVVHAGIAEKYRFKAFRDIPLIIKLNGRSSLSYIDPNAGLTCTVERAIKLGASAVGFTLYDGSPAEPEMISQFGRIVDEAHGYGIPVIAWMYPRGPDVVQDSDTIAYAARIGLELGADFVKLKYNGDPAGFDWVVRSAGRARVLVADREFSSDEEVLRHAYSAIQAGASGLAYGRTVWQHPKPFSLTRALHGIVFHGKTPEQVAGFLHQ